MSRLENIPTQQCPNCANYVRGSAIYGAEREVIRQTYGACATKGLLMGATTIIGSFFGGIGAIPGFMLGLLISRLFKERAVQEADDLFYDTTDFQFNCPCCSNSWVETYSKSGDYVPDTVLLQEMQEKISSASNSMGGHMVGMIINFAWFGISLWYCLTHESSHTEVRDLWLFGETNVTITNWYWWGACLGTGIAFLLLLYNIVSYFENSNKKNELEGMSVSQYRVSKYRNN